ncbi:MAG: nucleotidyltransferase family protein, partial [Methanobacteriota archaeon]
PHECIRSASEILQGMGYRLMFDGFGISSDLYHHQVLHPPPGIGYKSVELHWRLLYNPIEKNVLRFDAFFALSREIVVPWGSFRTLSPEDALLYAGLHMCIQHPGEIRLIWMADIVMLVKEITRQKLWDNVIKRSHYWKGRSSLMQTLELTSLWFGITLPAQFNLYDLADPDDNEIQSLITANRVITGREHKVLSQIRKMETVSGKCLALFHYLTATRAVCMSCTSLSLKEYGETWFSILKITLRRWRKNHQR